MLLKVANLQAGYGENQVLFDVSLEIRAGEVATLLGRNGMGKTTTISSIFGIVRPSSGEISFDGIQTQTMSSFRIARLGLGLVPEGRQIFPNLTVRENLFATSANRLEKRHPWTFESVLELFPQLKQRLDSMGALLSGGEQQMLAIGRALMTNPKLLVLDEATEGLAPLVRVEIWQVLRRLKEAGQSILIVDKNIAVLNQIADHHFILEKGQIVWRGTPSELTRDPSCVERYLGV